MRMTLRVIHGLQNTLLQVVQETLFPGLLNPRCFLHVLS
jgi:hypothetical protein